MYISRRITTKTGTHGTFLDLEIKIEDGIFVCKLFNEGDKFPFFIVHMPHFESNIPSTIFYGSIFSKFLRIARCTLKLEHFLPRASELYLRMLSQGENQSCINKQILKFSQTPSRTKNIFIFKIISPKLVLFFCKICNEKCSCYL